MFGAVLLLFYAVFIIIFCIVGGAQDYRLHEYKKERKDPIDQYMDDNYADIDWLRKGKL